MLLGARSQLISFTLKTDKVEVTDSLPGGSYTLFFYDQSRNFFKFDFRRNKTCLQPVSRPVEQIVKLATQISPLLNLIIEIMFIRRLDSISNENHSIQFKIFI